MSFLVLAIPVFFFQGWKLSVQWSGARTGDEPHYLVQAFSLAKDFDLEVSNNYGGIAQGRYLTNYTLDHHSNLVHRETGHAIQWDHVYRMSLDPGRPGHVRVDLRPEFRDLDRSDYREVAFRPPGYPALIALAAFPLIRLEVVWYETYVVLLQLLLLSYALARVGLSFAVSPVLPLLGAMTLSAWYFASTIYHEAITPSILLLALIAWWERRPWAVSAWTGLLFFIKESYAPLPVLFWTMWLLRANGPFSFREAFSIGWRLAALPLVAFGSFVLRSLWLYDRPIRTYIPFEPAPDVLFRLKGIWYGTDAEILGWEPVVIVLLIGLMLALATGRGWIAPKNRDADDQKREVRTYALLTIGLFLFQYLLLSSSFFWSGRPAYGIRLMVPFSFASLPGLFAVVEFLRDLPASRKLIFGVLAAPAFSASLANSFWAATHSKTAPFMPAPCLNLARPAVRTCLR